MKRLIIVIFILFFSTQAALSQEVKSGKAHFDFLSIGVSVHTLSVNASSLEMGLFNSVAPLNFSFSPKMFQSEWATGDNSTIGVSYWSFSVGFILQRAQGGNTSFGLSLVPYQFRLGNFSIGAGVSYAFQQKISFGADMVNVIIPMTYHFSANTK